jgi:hypothetical protein
VISHESLTFFPTICGACLAHKVGSEKATSEIRIPCQTLGSSLGDSESGCSTSIWLWLLTKNTAKCFAAHVHSHWAQDLECPNSDSTTGLLRARRCSSRLDACSFPRCFHVYARTHWVPVSCPAASADMRPVTQRNEVPRTYLFPLQAAHVVFWLVEREHLRSHCCLSTIVRNG